MTDLEYMICEAERYGEIDLATRNEMLNVITEKKTREEYKMRAFKKRHNFIPDKPGSKTGTITVNGQKVKIDLDKDKKRLNIYSNNDDGKDDRSTSYCTTTDTVYIDKTFFKRKNPKRIDAILQHEIGHKNTMNNKEYDMSIALANKYALSSKLHSEMMNEIRKCKDDKEKIKKILDKYRKKRKMKLKKLIILLMKEKEY